MYLTVHAAAAAYLSQQVDSPWLVFLLGLISHLVMDFIPHGDEYLFKDKKWQKQKNRLFMIVLLDLSLAAVFSYLFLWQISQGDIFLYAVALSGAWLPDFLAGSKLLLKQYLNREWVVLERVQHIHRMCHHYFRRKYTFTLNPILGMLVQLIIWFGFLYLLF